MGCRRSSPVDHPIMVTISELLEARYGTVLQRSLLPDSQHQRRSPVPRPRHPQSYGFSPFLVLSTDTMGVGGVNEGIALPAFLDGVEVYVELVRRLAT